MSTPNKELELPTPEEIEAAQKASRELAPLLKTKNPKLSLVTDSNRDGMVSVPPSALRLLVDVLTHIGQGRPVTVLPQNMELTTQEAADFLHVSRPFVCKLIDEKKLPARLVGRHRRISFEHLAKFQEIDRARRREALSRLAALDQELAL